MYINITSGIKTDSRTSIVSNKNYSLYWEGIFFIEGMQEGEESANELLSRLKPQADSNIIMNYFKDLKGNWSIFLHDRILDRWTICSDHGHQNYLFFTKTSVSNSFLRLRADLHDKANVDEEALLLFLYSGYCYTKSIFYSDINRLDYHDFIELTHSKITVKSKKLPDQFSKQIPDNFVTTLQSFFSSFNNHKLCLDLSGGTDTRALLIALNYLGVKFDVATYGDHLYSEVQIAQKAANLIGKELKYKDITSDDMNPDDLMLAWKACDGLDLDMDTYKFETWRSIFGYSLVISGTAGELYKDGGWYEAALRSGLALRGHAGLIRSLFDSCKMLWAGISIPELQSLVKEEHVRNIQQQISEIGLVLLRDNIGYPLLQASDRIFFDFSFNRPGGTRNSIINRYMPLYEPKMISIGVNQSIWKRLNHNLYRQECGILNRKVANIETDRLGLTLSPNYLKILMEYSKYVSTYFQIKLGHNLSFKTPNINKKVTADYVLNHPDLDKGIINLKERGYLNDKLAKNMLSSSVACRIVALHYLLES